MMMMMMMIERQQSQEENDVQTNMKIRTHIHLPDEEKNVLKKTNSQREEKNENS